MLFADNCDCKNCNIACRVWPGLDKGSSTMLDRKEIQEYIDLSNRSHFVESILNPLLNSELLLTTKESPNAPNQKYYTNKDKIKYK